MGITTMAMMMMMMLAMMASAQAPVLPDSSCYATSTPPSYVDLFYGGGSAPSVTLACCETLCSSWAWASAVDQVSAFLHQRAFECPGEQCLLASKFYYNSSSALDRRDCCVLGCSGCPTTPMAPSNLVQLLASKGVLSDVATSPALLDSQTILLELSNNRPVLLQYGMLDERFVVLYGFNATSALNLSDLAGTSQSATYFAFEPAIATFTQQTASSLAQLDTRALVASYYKLTIDRSCCAPGPNAISSAGHCLPPLPPTPVPTPPPRYGRAPHTSLRGCFAPESLAHLPSGRTKQLHELVLGDRVLTPDGSFSPIVAFLDTITVDARQPLEYLEIEIESNSREILGASALRLRITPEHQLVRVLERSDLAPSLDHLSHEFISASTLRVGDLVWATTSASLPSSSSLPSSLPSSSATTTTTLTHREFRIARVLSITTRHIGGAIAPLTRSGTIVVDGIAASCYSDYNHHVAQIAMLPLRYLPHWWFGGSSLRQPQGLHPYAASLLSIRRVLEHSLSASMW